MPLRIVRDDITRMHVDAIVNAANSSLVQGGGVCGAIFAAAGAARLAAACDAIGFCAPGQAVLTDGYDLPARYIIHTVGPVWAGGDRNEEATLRACYLNALQLADARGLASIAFPLLSSGAFGYPKDEAFSVAVSAIGAFLAEREMTVYLVVFEQDGRRFFSARMLPVAAYVDARYTKPAPSMDSYRRAEPPLPTNARPCALPRMGGRTDASPSGGAPSEQEVLYDACVQQAPRPMSAQPDAVDFIRSRQRESFSQMLLRLIDARGKTDPEVYKRANLDRKLFSKIRSNPQYRPSKNTALALAVALELNLDETCDLLRRAGFALSPASRFDLIVEYFIQNGRYDIFEINETLFAFDESLLGA